MRMKYLIPLFKSVHLMLQPHQANSFRDFVFSCRVFHVNAVELFFQMLFVHGEWIK